MNVLKSPIEGSLSELMEDNIYSQDNLLALMNGRA